MENRNVLILYDIKLYNIIILLLLMNEGGVRGAQCLARLVPLMAHWDI